MAANAEFGERPSGAELGEQSSGTQTADLLSRFGVSGCRDAALIDGISGREVELGLSLGGCFEVEPEKNKVVGSLSISIYDDERVVQRIAKTCSQQMEWKEELRKRKEIQSFKRLEAKRQRFEKRAFRTGAKHDSDRGTMDRLIWGSQGPSGLSNFDCRLEHESSSYNEDKTSPFSILLSASRSSNCTRDETSPFNIPLSLNQASNIILMKDEQSNKMFKVANPIISVEEDKQSKKKFDMADKAKELERSLDKQSKKKFDIADKAMELERSRLEGKLCVSAQGDGPNGRKIQGLLYKYENGMAVIIVCLCHGSFLTPAEFVKHAGGGDVAHPLQHIIVSRPPFTF